MFRSLIAFAILFITQTALAETVTRKPVEEIKDFALRHAPNKAAELVMVTESNSWKFKTPVIAAFYSYHVTYADPSKNYNEPTEHEVIGYVFIPTASGKYEKIEIDSFGPEGSNAEIDGVQFWPTNLAVSVSWSPNAGELHQTCVYGKPKLGQPLIKLRRVKS